MNRSCILRAAIAFMLLAGCHGPGELRQIATPAASIGRASPSRTDGDLLYVSNSGLYGLASVTLYGDRQRKLVRTITDGIKYPIGITLDRLGNLYVANYDASTVTVYANAGRRLTRTISRNLRRPVQVALDSIGNLYVRDERGIAIFENARSRIVHRIRGRGSLFYTFALDSSNNLYVATRRNVVNVYAPGSLTPTRTISDGIEVPVSLAFDNQGNLYVANGTGGGYCGHAEGGSVTIYAPGSNSPFETISPSQGICSPAKLAFSRSGNLYVANETLNETEGSVLEYAPASNTLLLTITQGINSPIDLVFDLADNLYVINGWLRNVTEYAPGSTSILRTITDGVNSPKSLADGAM